MRKRITSLLSVLSTLCGAQYNFPNEGLYEKRTQFEINHSSLVVGFAHPITQRSVASLKKEFADLELPQAEKPWLRIRSPGGEADAMIELSDFVDENVGGLVVDSDCFSACGELLLTIKRPVILGPNAEVKFHMNPLMARQLLTKAKIVVPACIERRASWYETNFNARMSASAWTAEVKKALSFTGKYKFHGKDDGGCDNYTFRSKGAFYVTPLNVLENLTDGRIFAWKQRK